MPNRATDQTPFALVYRTEAVLPTKLTYGSPRVLAYEKLQQERLRQDDAMLLEAAMRAARYQQALHRYHSRKVHARSFEEGDLVL